MQINIASEGIRFTYMQIDIASEEIRFTMILTLKKEKYSNNNIFHGGEAGWQRIIW
jgi:hypothetical protein